MQSKVNVQPFYISADEKYQLPLFLTSSNSDCSTLYQIIERLDGQYSLIFFQYGFEQTNRQSHSLNELVDELLKDGMQIVNVDVEVNK